MPGPGVYGLQLYQGDSYRWEFVLWLDAEKEQPADLAGAEAHATIRIGEDRHRLPCEVTLPNTVVMSIPSELSERLCGNGLWDLRLVRADSTVQTIMRGNVSVMASVNGRVIGARRE